MIRPDYRQIKQSSELYHYGIPRRSGRYPWGSGKRPYQDALKGKSRSDYFTSERTIPKGTKMYRTVSSKDSSIDKNSPTYVTYLQTDRDLYKGGNLKIRDNAKNTYEYKMTLNEDLKIPSRKTFVNTIKEVVDKNPNLFKESVETYLDMAISQNKSDAEIFIDPLTGKYDLNRWNNFVERVYLKRKDRPIEEQWGMISTTLGKSDKMKNAIIDDLKSKGYNAMVDESGVGGSGRHIEGIDPLIIFDSSVLNVNKISQIKKKEEEKSKSNYLKWAKEAERNRLNW